jgi:AraC family transcriptional regulator
MSIEIVELPEMKVMTSQANGLKEDEIGPTLGELLPAVFTHVITNGGQPTGMPFARYDLKPDHTFHVEAGAPVAEHVAETETIKRSVLPGGPAAKLVHTGPYENLSSAHMSVHAWMKENGREAVGLPWEVYLTDPGQEPDNSKWVTEVYYPLRPVTPA